MNKTILLTAFDPFGGDSINPALMAMEKVKFEKDGFELVKIQVPTVFYKSIETVTEAMKKYRPYGVICLGQAGGRNKITIERVAINIMDASIPDNEGNLFVDKIINPEGKNAYFSTLPIKRIADSINKIGVPCDVSNTAGTFVCNNLMYGILDYVSCNNMNVKAGFIHVPFVKEQLKGRNYPYMELDDIVKAIETAIYTLCSEEKYLDTNILYGKES